MARVLLCAAGAAVALAARFDSASPSTYPLYYAGNYQPAPPFPAPGTTSVWQPIPPWEQWPQEAAGSHCNSLSWPAWQQSCPPPRRHKAPWRNTAVVKGNVARHAKHLREWFTRHLAMGVAPAGGVWTFDFLAQFNVGFPAQCRRACTAWSTGARGQPRARASRSIGG